MIQTREDVIDLQYRLMALIRKAQCRQVNCDILDKLDAVEKMLAQIDNDLTEIIGD